MLLDRFPAVRLSWLRGQGPPFHEDEAGLWNHDRAAGFYLELQPGRATVGLDALDGRTANRVALEAIGESIADYVPASFSIELRQGPLFPNSSTRTSPPSGAALSMTPVSLTIAAARSRRRRQRGS